MQRGIFFCWEWSGINNKRVSWCVNKEYLTVDVQDMDGGFVAFGGSARGGKITGKGKIRTDKEFSIARTLQQNGVAERKNKTLIKAARTMLAKENDTPIIEDWVFDSDEEDMPKGNPQQDLKDKGVIDMDALVKFFKSSRKDNMYNVDLRNVVPQGGFTCLFAKATPDESNLWNRRLGHVMNQFCEMKGIKREFSLARTPQQNEVAESKNMRLIEAARTMLADSKLPTTFWAKVVNTACLKLYETIWCPVTILNTIDHLDALTKSMNYKLVVVGNQSNGNASTKACDDASKARVETVPKQDYILLPLWTQDPSFSFSPKSSPDVGFKPLGEEENKDTKDSGNESEVPSTKEPRVDQEKENDDNSTNNINTVSSTINATSIKNNVADNNEASPFDVPDDLNMPDLEDIGIFSDAEDDDVEADMTNLDIHIPVSPIPITRIHKDHPVAQIFGDIHSTPQTRRMSKIVTEHGFALMDLPHGKRAIGTKWVYRNKKDERGIMIRNKTRLKRKSVYQPSGFEDPDFTDKVYKIEKALYGLHQAPRAWVKGDILLVQLYVDDIIFGSTKKKFGISTVKTGSTPMETLKPLMKDENAEDVDVYLYRSMIGSLMYLTSSRPDIVFDVRACARFHVTPNVSHLHAVKRIFRYLKGQPKLGLWYPKDLPFDLEAYTDSDYAGASLDRKPTT
ncbi:putative ribonuclease H-like domain-containing protein [Tanacetum coccineum]|uniref:Ribonuclease H-like domain-containing protein n=1 Tax=Tanacetum coccineum TaxID=301880 RepID=A0ABQ5IB38_9ASTR